MNAGDSLRKLRDRKPLIHQITNYVVMNETANATLALGALPVMAHAREEVEEMVGLAGALVLNIGDALAAVGRIVARIAAWAGLRTSAAFRWSSIRSASVRRGTGRRLRKRILDEVDVGSPARQCR